jgi:hypothetical protein
MMKKYSLLFLFAILSNTTISCSNDDISSKEDALTGVWKLTSLTVETPVQVKGVTTSNFTQISSASDSQINFDNNSAGTMRYLSGLGYFSQTKDNAKEYSETSGFVLFSFKSVLKNNIVTLYEYNNETLSLTLDGNTLTFEKEGGIVIGNLDNNTFNHVTTKYVFTKQ